MDARLASYLHAIGADPDAMSGWIVRAAQRSGVDVALVVTRGPEIHLLPLAGRHTMTRRNVRQFLAPILDEHGYATTRVPLAETDHRLREALGFVQTHRDDACTYWALTALPYERTKEGSTPCPSQS